VDTYGRAQQFRSVLAFAAREQKIVSYEMLHQMTGMAQECGRELGHIYYYCVAQKLPLLNLLAVSKDSGKPGAGCPANLAELPAQQTRVFIYDWLKHGAPTAEDFKKCRESAKKP